MAKIAIIHPFFNERGGAERKALLLAQAAQKAGHIVKIYTFSWKPKLCFSEYMQDLEYEVFNYGNSFFAHLKALYTMANSLNGFDILHAHNYPANIIVAIAKKKYAIPTIYYCNEPFLYEKGAFSRNNALLIFTLRFFEKFYMKYIDILVGNSKYTTKRISQIFKKNAICAYSGIDTSLFVPPSRRIIKNPTIITVNRLTPEKKIDKLLPIMNKIWLTYPKAKLIIIGKGSEKKRLQKLFSKKNVVFLENISTANLIKQYQQSTIFIFTAEHEPLGVTPIEAMSCGLPVIAHNSGGPKETVIHGKTGFLVSSIEEYAQYTLELITNPSLYIKMSKTARKRASDSFSITSMNNFALNLYRKIKI